MNEFKCPNCKRDDDLSWSAEQDDIFCRRCKLSVPLRVAQAGKPIWLTKDMRAMLIEDMETSHIQHSISLIFHRNNGWRGRFMEPLIEELKKRSAEEIPY